MRYLTLFLLSLLCTAHASAQSRYCVKFRGEAPAWVRVVEEGEVRQIGVHVIRGTAKAAAAIAGECEFVEEDRRVAPDFVPNDPSYPSQWAMPKISAPAAWDVSTGTGVTIAILDTGCDPTHPDLQASYVAGWNFYDNTADTHDVFGHGTATAGIAGASGNNGIGVAGTAFNARIMPCRISDTSGYGYFSTAANALTWAADHGARVANISYQMTDSSTVRSASQYFQQHGGVVVISAGNSGLALTTIPSPYIVTVGSTNPADARSSWSNYGAPVTLYAPGESILTTNNGGGYGYWTGTSESAPIVAGVAALCFSKHPEWTAPNCMDALVKTADVVGGVPRVNAAAAVGAVYYHTLDTTPPAVAIVSPLAGSIVPRKLTVSVSATDDTGVTSIALYLDGALQQTDTAAPYTFTFGNTSRWAKGSHVLEARASDAAGNVGAASVSVVK